MSHDLIAELGAYRVERGNLAAVGKDERAELVDGEIERVTAAITARADELDAQADEHDEHGRDGLAGEARIESRRYREAITPPGENASQSAPRHRARPRQRTNRAQGDAADGSAED